MVDVVGYSRFMEADEVGALLAVKQHRCEVIDPAITAHRGRVVKLMGDGTLVEFASVVDAVNVAMITLSLVSNMLMINVRRAR